jgi:hypothetical protein
VKGNGKYGRKVNLKVKRCGEKYVKESKLKSEKIWEIQKKGKLNSEHIWKTRKKSRLNSKIIWKI